MTDIGSTSFRSTPLPTTNTTGISELLARGGAKGVDGATSVGAGVVTSAGAAPAVLSGMAVGAMMASLSAIMPKMSGEQLDVLVTSFTEKMKEASDASNKDQIKTDQQAKRASIAEKKAKIEESIKKQAEAEDKLKHASLIDKIKLAFQYLGAVLAIAGGIAAMALAGWTGVGAFGGAMMIASGLCMLTMAVDSTVQVAQHDQGKGDLGMFGMMCKAIAKSEGKSEEEAEKIGQQGAMGASIALGAMAAIFGIAGAGAGIADSAMAVENLAVKVTSDVIDVATDVTNIAASGVDIASGVEHYEASNLQADSLHAKADGKRMEAVQAFLDNAIDMAIASLKGSGDRFNSILDGITDAMHDKASTISHAQFRA